jgi:thiol-disulfide isomerase/thioredoxin
MKKLVLVCLLTLLLTGCARVTQPDAPEFELENVAGGLLKSSDLKGKVVIVDFWATWCVPCIQEIPNYNALHKELAGKDVALIGFTVESGTLEDVKAKVEEFGASELAIEYPLVMGTEDAIEGFGGYIGIPTTFVIGKDWKIHRKILGNVPGKKEALNKEIALLLAK